MKSHRVLRTVWALLAAALSASPSWAATYTEFNNAGTFTWNAAPWTNGIPNGIDNGAITSGSGLIRGGGTVVVDGTSTGTTPNSLLVGWAGNGNLNVTGGTLTVGDFNTEGFAVGESGIGVVTQSGGTVNATALRFGRLSGGGTYNLNSGMLVANQIVKGAGTGTFNFNGGTLRAGAGGASWFGAGLTANVQAGGAIIDTQAFNVTINSALLNAGGGLTKQGSGTLTLAGNNNYNGLTNISLGRLQIGNNDASTNLGASSFSLTAGTELIFSRNIDNTEFTTQSIGGSGNVIFQGQQTGYFTFRNAYSGTWNHTGTTIVNLNDAAGNQWYQGTLWLEKDNVHSTNAALDLQSGKIYLRNSTGVGQTFKGISGAAGTFIATDQANQRVNIDVATGQTFTYNGVIGADGSGVGNNSLVVTKLGAGTQILTGANTYSGGTAISNGTLQIGNGGATGEIGSGNISITSPGNLTINRNNAYTISSNISGNGTFTQAGSGTTTLTGALSYNGQTSITGGALQIGNNNPSTSVGASSFVLSNGADLIFSRNIDNTEFTTQAISGQGDLIFRGQQTGYFTFRNAYTATMNHTGTTVVNLDDAAGNLWYQGTLWLEKDNVHSPNAAMVLQSGKIYMRNSGGTGQTFAGLSGSAGTFITTDQGLQKVNINAPGSQLHVFAGAIGADGSGTGNNNVAVTKSGTGTQVFSGANTYTGTTNVTAGILAIDGTHTGAGSYTVQSGATLGGDGVITFAAGNSLSVSGSPGRLSPGNTTDPAYLGADRTYSQGTDVRTVGTLTLNASSPAAMALDMDGILQLDIVSPVQHDLLNIASGFVTIDSNPVTGAVLEINGQQNFANIDFGALGVLPGMRVDLLIASAINGNFRNFPVNSYVTDAGGRPIFFGNDGTTLYLQAAVPEPGSMVLWSIVSGCMLLSAWRWRRNR